jgi:predicted transporter
MTRAWKDNQRTHRKAALIVAGAILLLVSAGTLLNGKLFYRDWRDLNVFAPVEILFSLFLIGAGIFGFRK